MRRKLFFCAVITVFTAFFWLGTFPDSAVPHEAVGDSEAALHRGRVLRLYRSDERLTMILRDERGFKVRLNCYAEVEKAWELTEAVIEYRARLAVPEGARNPHCFDYRRYMRSQGEYLVGTVERWKVCEPAGGILRTYKRYMNKLKYSFEMTLPENVRGIVIGMVFGDTGGMDSGVYDEFRRNGTAHILAVSGLHIGLIYKIYERLSRGRNGICGILILAFVMLTYGMLSSWRPSVIRAELMAAMKTAAKIKELRYDGLTAMALCALILIIANPYVIFGAGFQMSFLSVASMEIIVKIIPRKVPETLSRTVAVSAVLMIYQAYEYNRINLLSWLINIPVIYLAGITIPAAVLSFTCFALYVSLTGDAGLPEILTVPVTALSETVIRVNGFMTLGDIGLTESAALSSGAAVFCVTAALFGASESALIMKIRGEKKSLLKIFILILAVSAGVGAVSRQPMRYDQIVFVDVGQGACTHIKSGNADVLIDGGGSRLKNTGEDVLKPYLLKNGRPDLELALITHEDTDHYKGIAELADCFKVKKIVRDGAAGDRYVIDEGVEIRTLWPLERETSRDGNENSSCYMVIYGGVRVLITGDLDKRGEREMTAYYTGIGRRELLKADVLNVGHHGSETSTSDELIDAVSPSLAVIQVGKNNYGHPSEEVLERLKKRGIPVLRNDLNGAIGLRIGSRGFLHMLVPGRRGESSEITEVHVMIK